MKFRYHPTLRQLAIAIAIATAIAAAARPALAVTRYYVGPDGGSWSSSANWAANPTDPGGASVPTTGDIAVLNNSTQTVLDVSDSIANLTLGNVTSTTPSLLQNGNALTLNALNMATVSGANANYTLNAGNLTVSSETLGGPGAATFTQNGGNHTVATLTLGSLSTYHFLGGNLSVTNGFVPKGAVDFGNATGTVSFSVGSSNFNELVSSPIDLSAATVTGGSQTTLFVGPNTLAIFPSNFNPYTSFKAITGTGAVYQLGATLDIPAGSTALYSETINDFVTAEGTIHELGMPGIQLTLKAGVFVAGGNVGGAGANSTLYVDNLNSGMSSGGLVLNTQYIGYNGIGKFTQTGGTNNTKTSSVGKITMYVGYNAGSNGTYLISAGTLDTAFYDGYSGNGTFTQSGGTVFVDESDFFTPVYLGYNLGATGNYNLSAGSLFTHAEYIGYSGNGTFIQSGGNHNIPLQQGFFETFGGFLDLGFAAGTVGNYTLSNSAVLTVFSESVGVSGTGHFVQTGGNHTVQTTLTLAKGSDFTLTGGSLTAATIQSFGNLTLLNPTSFSVTNLFTQSIPGTFSASGNLTAHLNISGAIFPGANHTPGTLNIFGYLDAFPGSVFHFDLGNPDSATGDDLINVLPAPSLSLPGNLTLNGDISVSDLGKFGPGTYVLFTFSGNLTNSLPGNLTLDPLPRGLPGALSVSNNQILLTVAPEPTTALLLTPALLLTRRRRRTP